MTDAQIQTLIDAARTSSSDLVTWTELKEILEALKGQTSLIDLGTPSAGQIPKYNGTAWALASDESSGGGGSSTLDGLTDVNTAGAVTGQVLKFNGTAWVADDDETATPGAGGTLDQVLVAGNTTDEGIIFDETLTIPTVDGTSVTKIWFKFDNLAKTTESDPYQRVPFQISQKAVRQGGNAPTGKVNETMMFGWNLNPGGGNEIAGRPGIGISMESNFRDAGQRLVEMHDFYLTPTNQQIRLASYTCRTADFVLDFYHTVSRFYLKLPDLANVQNEKQYFVVSPSTNSVNMGIGIDMGGRDGSIKSVTFEAAFAAGGGFSINNAGLTVPEFYSQGFTHWNLPGLRTGQIGTSSNVMFLGTTSSVVDFQADKVFDIGVVSRRLNSAHIAQMQTQTKAGDATTSDIPAGYWMVYKNTSTGVLRLWANDGGTMRSVTLS